MSLQTMINKVKSYEKVNMTIKDQILLKLYEHQGNYTSRQIAKMIGRKTRQDVQPRLTEMARDDLIEEAENEFDDETERMVVTYKISDFGEQIAKAKLIIKENQ